VQSLSLEPAIVTMQAAIRSTVGTHVAEDAPDIATIWLPVIGRSLAYLCLADAIRHDPEKYKDTLAKVDFLEALGLSQKDAAEAAGSTAESVRVMKFNRLKKHGKGNKGRKKARARRR
jgi:hypothetical protein